MPLNTEFVIVLLSTVNEVWEFPNGAIVTPPPRTVEWLPAV
jgi:hypothetical protein